jgi:hypothetical protein
MFQARVLLATLDDRAKISQPEAGRDFRIPEGNGLDHEGCVSGYGLL